MGGPKQQGGTLKSLMGGGGAGGGGGGAGAGAGSDAWSPEKRMSLMPGAS